MWLANDARGHISEAQSCHVIRQWTITVPNFSGTFCLVAVTPLTFEPDMMETDNGPLVSFLLYICLRGLPNKNKHRLALLFHFFLSRLRTYEEGEMERWTGWRPGPHVGPTMRAIFLRGVRSTRACDTFPIVLHFELTGASGTLRLAYIMVHKC